MHARPRQALDPHAAIVLGATACMHAMGRPTLLRVPPPPCIHARTHTHAHTRVKGGGGFLTCAVEPLEVSALSSRSSIDLEWTRQRELAVVIVAGGWFIGCARVSEPASAVHGMHAPPRVLAGRHTAPHGLVSRTGTHPLWLVSITLNKSSSAALLVSMAAPRQSPQARAAPALLCSGLKPSRVQRGGPAAYQGSLRAPAGTVQEFMLCRRVSARLLAVAVLSVSVPLSR